MKLNTPNIKIVASADKPARKYTEYNLFFQLEREYILQKRFGVKSTVDPDNVFVQNDPKYLGPPLPKRYRDLVLTKHWHIPGKSSKKNRKHTKTHVSPFIMFCSPAVFSFDASKVNFFFVALFSYLVCV